MRRTDETRASRDELLFDHPGEEGRARESGELGVYLEGGQYEEMYRKGTQWESSRRDMDQRKEAKEQYCSAVGGPD